MKLFKKGLLICFVGIDGSGKTTQVQRLICILRKEFNCKYVYGRWRPILSYPFMAFLRATRYTRKKVPQEGRTYLERYYYLNKAVTLTWLFLVWCDATISFFFSISIPRRMGAKIVVCDRYIYDILVDAMADLRDSSLFRKFPARMISVTTPKPDIVFLMDVPESVAFARKKDTPNIDYLRIRRKLYFELATRFSFLVLDSTKSSRTNAEKVVATLHKFFPMFESALTS